MLHKLMMIGSVASLGPWGGSIAYFIGPLFWIRGIAYLKATRDCYVALKGSTTKNQLLACKWKTDNSTLNFYLHSMTSSQSVSIVKTLKIKAIDNSDQDRNFSVKFLFGGWEDLKVYKWSLDSNRWVKQDERTFDLTGFCKSISVSSYTAGSLNRLLTCKWGEGPDQQETWPALT